MRTPILPGGHDPVNRPGSHNRVKSAVGGPFALHTPASGEVKGISAVPEAAGRLAERVGAESAEDKRRPLGRLATARLEGVPPSAHGGGTAPAASGVTPSGQAGGGREGEAPLGNMGVFAAIGSQSGLQPIDLEKRRAIRAERYGLKYAAAKLLGSLPLLKCRRTRWDDLVRHHQSRAEGGASYLTGLQSCRNLWLCACCAAQISEFRRRELTEAVQRWTGQGGAVVMLTLTAPHYVGDELRDNLDGILGAYRWMMMQRRWRDWMRSQGAAGSVRALEVTHGRNGWHPHLHVLLFLGDLGLPVKRDADWQETKPLRDAAFTAWASVQLDGLWELWADACTRKGLRSPSREHGVNLSDSDTTAEYVSKWGLEAELTKAQSKQGKEKGRTPWDLLRAYKGGDQEAGGLFRVYADAFRRRKQLTWSRGLRDLLGLGAVVEDQDVPEQLDQEDAFLGAYSSDQWAVIEKDPAHIMRLLELGDEGDWGRIQAYLGSIGAVYVPPLAEVRDEEPGDLAVYVWEMDDEGEWVQRGGPDGVLTG